MQFILLSLCVRLEFVAVIRLLQSSGNVTSCSKLSLVSSLKSPPSQSQRLLLELTFVLFAPWPGMQMRLCICEGESEAKMVLSPISLGAPLLSCHHSLAPGTRHSCGGNHSVGNVAFPSVSNSKWHLFRATAVHATSQKTGQRHVLRGSGSVEISTIYV